MERSPLEYHRERPSGQRTAEYQESFDFDQRFVLAIDRVEMRRLVVAVEHSDRITIPKNRLSSGIGRPQLVQKNPGAASGVCQLRRLSLSSHLSLPSPHRVARKRLRYPAPGSHESWRSNYPEAKSLEIPPLVRAGSVERG